MVCLTALALSKRGQQHVSNAPTPIGDFVEKGIFCHDRVRIVLVIAFICFVILLKIRFRPNIERNGQVHQLRRQSRVPFDSTERSLFAFIVTFVSARAAVGMKAVHKASPLMF
jgi:hypothetical protein